MSNNTPTKRRFHDGPSESINNNNDHQDKKLKIDQDITKSSQETNTTTSSVPTTSTTTTTSLSAEEKKRLLKERLAKKVEESKKEINAIIESESKPQQSLSTPSININTTTTTTNTTTSTKPITTNINNNEDVQFNELNNDKEENENLFYDPRIKTSNDKKKRLNSFNFIKQGRYTKKADKIRQQALEEEINKQQEANQLLKKTLGDEVIETFIVSQEDVPNIEWWDEVILKPLPEPAESTTESAKQKHLEDIVNAIGSDNTKSILDTEYWNYIEHPVKLKTMIQSKDNKILPIRPDFLLLSKERKKIKKNRKEEERKEKQARILNGLEPPPENKIKLSNLMRNIATQAILDPTKAILEVTKKIEERRQLHDQKNQERKLTPEQRKEKEKEKILRDAKELYCSIYKVIDLSHPLYRTKVSKNATDFYGSGCIVFYNSMNLVVFEAGLKAQKKFKKLMCNRIDWENPPPSTKESTTTTTTTAPKVEYPKPPAGTVNSCNLVWEGPIHKPSFKGFHFEVCQIESQARKYLQESGVPHYWDLIKNFTNE